MCLISYSWTILKVAIFTVSFIHNYKLVRSKQKGFGLATVVSWYPTIGTHGAPYFQNGPGVRTLYLWFWQKKRRQQQSIDSGKAAFQGLSVKERKNKPLLTAHHVEFGAFEILATPTTHDVFFVFNKDPSARMRKTFLA